MSADGRESSAWLSALLASFAVAFSIGGVIPLQSYLANAASFGYGLDRFICECLPGCAVLWVCLAVIFWICRRFGLVWVLLLAVALTVAALLEAGPLSIGVPAFDGRYSIYKSHSRQCWDLAAWVLIVGLPFLFRKTLCRHLPLVSLIVVLYAASTVLDVRRDCESKAFDRADGYLIESMMSQRDVIGSVAYSPVRNVFLLIVDSMPAHVATEIFRQSPKLADRFDGFVNCVDHMGMHWPTRVAIPGMFSGRYYTVADTSANFLPYTHAYIRKGSFLEDYLSADVPLFMTLDMGYGGYTNRRVATMDGEKSAGNQRMTGALAWSVGEIAAFRAMPYVAKRHYLRRLVHRWRRLNADGWYGSDEVMWPALSGRGVRSDWPMTLQIHHTWGVHPPTKDGVIRDGTAIFERLGDFLDALRAKRIYDSSTILLAADHGIGTGLGLQRHAGIPESAFPMLLVKAVGAHGSLRQSEAPTTHAALADVLRALRTEDLEEGKLIRLLSRTNRLVRDGEKGCVTDWTVGLNGVVETKTYKENEK